MHFLRCLWYFSAYLSIIISARHIPGVSNTSTDQPSIKRSSELLKMNLHASTVPEAIPLSLLKLLSPKTGMDFPLLSAPLQAYHQQATNTPSPPVTPRKTL